MQVRDSEWQGCFGYWQPLFIHQNLLSLGHAAWKGFLSQGKGLVVCDVAVGDAESLDWQSVVVPFTTCFIPKSEVAEYLRSLKLASDKVAHLLNAVQTYHPDRDIVLFICGNGQKEMTLLQNLAISPPDCYRQVSERWDEFALQG